jgi:hypothetical protein
MQLINLEIRSPQKPEVSKDARNEVHVICDWDFKFCFPVEGKHSTCVFLEQSRRSMHGLIRLSKLWFIVLSYQIHSFIYL